MSSIKAAVLKASALVSMLAIVAVWIGADGAAAQVAARDRPATLSTMIKSCVGAGRKDSLLSTFPAATVRAYCECSARYVVDHATMADIDAGQSKLRPTTFAAARACIDILPRRHKPL